MFRRKIYDTLLSWKKESDGHTALLIEGARRLDVFQEKFSSQILRRYLIYTKDIGMSQDVCCFPVYMTAFL